MRKKMHEQIPGDHKKIGGSKSHQHEVSEPYPSDGAHQTSDKSPEAGFKASSSALHKGQEIMGDNEKTATSGVKNPTRSEAYPPARMPQGGGGHYDKPNK